ncbi:MAG: isochorismatase family protein [Planctomycetes bacterium]|nr:isochorismatase family protein [Planctomycetota bacterium]
MYGQTNGRRYPFVAVDLNTQADFCLPDGARPVANVAALIPTLRRVIAWAKRNGAPLISSIHSRRASEVSSSSSPMYCVDGTDGQRKMAFTIFRSRQGIRIDNTLCVPLNLFTRFQQVIFRQRGEDLLGNPKADRFVTQLPTEEFIVFGNVVEGSVKAFALGLVARERKVVVVRDACGYWDRAAADLCFRLLAIKGVGVITVDELLTRRLPDRYRLRLGFVRSGVCSESFEQKPTNGKSSRRNGRGTGNGSSGNGPSADRLRRRPPGGIIPQSRNA